MNDNIEISTLKEIVEFLKTHQVDECYHKQNYDQHIYKLLNSLDVDVNYLDNYQMIEDKDISTMSIDDLKTMYTYLLRGERFCTGHIAMFIEDGRLLKLAQRHLSLVIEKENNDK